MRSLVLRTLGGVVAAGLSLSAGAAPAAADTGTSFRLSAGGVAGQGTYRHLTGGSGLPVRITGTLAGHGWSRCAVIQVAVSGPADGIEWRTFGRHCGPGRTDVRVRASYLFRGVQPPVRLCAGGTVEQAELRRRCDQYRPASRR